MLINLRYCNCKNIKLNRTYVFLENDIYVLTTNQRIKPLLTTVLIHYILSNNVRDDSLIGLDEDNLVNLLITVNCEYSVFIRLQYKKAELLLSTIICVYCRVSKEWFTRV